MLIRTITIDKDGNPTPEELVTVRGSGIRFNSQSGSDWEVYFETVPKGGWLTVDGKKVKTGDAETIPAYGQSNLYEVSMIPGNFDRPDPKKKPHKRVTVDVRQPAVRKQTAAAPGSDPDIIIEEC